MPKMLIRYQIDTPMGRYLASSRVGGYVYTATPAKSLDGGKYDAPILWFFEGTHAVGMPTVIGEVEVRDVQKSAPHSLN